jgi:hypothetical protein
MENLVADFTISNENTINAEYSIEQDNFDCSFEIFASGVVWGAITGNITDQTDLINILNEKATISYVDTNIQSEATSRAESDTLLQNNINTLSGNLTSEINARTLADNNLQTQIDDINTAGYITKDVNDLSYYMLTTDINTALNGKQNTISDLTDIRNNAENGNTAYNTIQNYGDIVTYNADNFATANQGALADTSIQPNNNITLLNNNAGYITGIDNTDVVNALGYTPYDSSNPAGYITSASLPTVNNSTITIQKNGLFIESFNLNQANNETINITVPTDTNDLTNNAGFITSADLPTLADLTTPAQMNAINSGATSTNIGQIATNTTAISTETLNRQNADNDLQSQIDAIVSSSDVFDIVGTYAELQAYDISTVPANDIIKVLVDDTHNNSATYYRCVETDNVKSWSYIGSEGAYYTKSEADGRFVTNTSLTTILTDYVLSSDLSTTLANYVTSANLTTILDDYATKQWVNNQGYALSSNLATVATSGSYNDLADKPYIPSDVVVDQTYDGTSTNAQSGVAIESELTNYVKAFNTENVVISSDQSFTFSGGKTSIDGSSLRGLSFRVSDNDDEPLNYFFIGTGLYDNSFTLQTLFNSVSLYVPEDGKLAIGRGRFSTGYSNIATETWVGNQGYLTGITSSDVTTALGFTPYNASNPDGYITSSALTPYALISSLSTVATSGLYSDLTGLPTIPTMTSQLTNDSNFITSADLPTNYVTTNTAQDISGRKTFLGEKAIYFKQQATSNKLGFTLYNPSNTELGALEYRPNTISGASLLALNCPQTTGGYVGFRYWGTPAVNIVAPKVATAGNYYIPTHITNGTNTVTANNQGTVNISSLLPDVSNYVTNSSLATTLADYVTNSALTTTLADYALKSDIPDISTKQDTLVSGTNIKTVNNTSLLGSGNIDTSEIFVVYYNRTNFDTIVNASSNKTVYCQLSSGTYDIYPLIELTQNMAYFSKVNSNGTLKILQVDNNNVWTTTTVTIPSITNLANKDLSNLSTTGQAIIDGKADTDLSNLSSTGKAVIDGQWVSDTSNIVSSNITVTTSYSNNWSLASYLPNDNYNYEVLFSIYGTTASNSGATLDLRMGTDLILDDNNDAGVMALRGQTRTNSAMGYANCLILPVGTNRKVYIKSYGTGVLSVLRVQAYRRLGTNS